MRQRLLIPMIALAVLAAVFVAAVSAWLGTRWATEDMDARFDAISQTLSRANFPLTPNVLESLAELTQTELITLDDSGNLLESTLKATTAARLPNRGTVSIAGRSFQSFTFPTVNRSIRSDRVSTVAVLFDENSLNASRRRAASLPLATGLSTILGLTIMTYMMTSRWVRRVGQLQRSVEAVSLGKFNMAVSDHVGDEIGRLGGAVDSMARQLDHLWKQVNREQSEKLLHQVASGMAHQLRNSLTGARMAIELHASQCTTASDEGIRVAIHQLEVAEDYVRRLLMVASGRQDIDRPMPIQVCWDDVRTSLSPLAAHLRVDILWESDEAIGGYTVNDGPSWVAAVTNLVQNAMQVADQVQVRATVQTASSMGSNNIIRVQVSDNGPGVPDSVADELFEPFVTSKLEGLGLGLPVVRRAAAHLGGDVRWQRESNVTVFEFDAVAQATAQSNLLRQ